MQLEVSSVQIGDLITLQTVISKIVVVKTLEILKMTSFVSGVLQDPNEQVADDVSVLGYVHVSLF